jgi:hypothetical protein
LHSPILTPGPWDRQPLSLAEVGGLRLASCLEPCPPGEADGNPTFKHPSGYEVEAREKFMEEGLIRLQPLWPRGLAIGEVFPDVNQAEEDLRLLHRNGLVELRCVEPENFGIDGGPLNRLEYEWGGYQTTPYHTTSGHEAGRGRSPP